MSKNNVNAELIERIKAASEVYVFFTPHVDGCGDYAKVTKQVALGLCYSYCDDPIDWWELVTGEPSRISMGY